MTRYSIGKEPEKAVINLPKVAAAKVFEAGVTEKPTYVGRYEGIEDKPPNMELESAVCGAGGRFGWYSRGRWTDRSVHPGSRDFIPTGQTCLVTVEVCSLRGFVFFAFIHPLVTLFFREKRCFDHSSIPNSSTEFFWPYTVYKALNPFDNADLDRFCAENAFGRAETPRKRPVSSPDRQED